MTSPAPQNPPSPSPSEPAPGGGAKPPSAPAKKTKRLGDYELVGKLGQGAMGTVYLAKQISTSRQVALKILPQEMAQDEEFLERFRREARAASRITHTNVVAAYDVGVADNYHYIAMEFVDGPNLETILQKKGKYNEASLLKITLDMCAALEAAEAQGIVHRDIKPANILMNSQGMAKLTDMGLASASKGDQRVTMAGFAVGTPYYISPEQAKGVRDVDGRSDIYSLGVTLYHLATGTLPFSGTNPVLIMTQHVSEVPQPPNERDPSISKPLSSLIQKMMAKDPDDRPQTAKQLREAVERCQRGEIQVMIQRMKAAKEKAVQAAVPPPAATRKEKALQSGKGSGSFADTIFGLVDSMLPFIPADARIPVAAISLTVFLLGAMWILVVVFKH